MKIENFLLYRIIWCNIFFGLKKIFKTLTQPNRWSESLWLIASKIKTFFLMILGCEQSAVKYHSPSFLQEMFLSAKLISHGNKWLLNMDLSPIYSNKFYNFYLANTSTQTFEQFQYIYANTRENNLHILSVCEVIFCVFDPWSIILSIREVNDFRRVAGGNYEISY